MMTNQQTVITDGCDPGLVSGARFDGVLEIPFINRPHTFEVPSHLVPFSKRNRVEPERFAVCCYENDEGFAELLSDPDSYIDELKRFQAVISPDASLFWDAPLAAQITNKYRSQAIGYYLQRNGVKVIPNVRWGDERTYTSRFLPESLAFLGVEKKSIVAIGTYGQVKSSEEKKQFKAGLSAMLSCLEPEIVLVYGSMPSSVFDDFKRRTEFVRYPDWTSYIKEITPDKLKAERSEQ